MTSTIEWMTPFSNRKMRGPHRRLSAEKLRVATKRSGRSSASRKQAKLTGLGKPFTRSTVSAMDEGLPVVPAAGAQGSSSAASARAPPAPAPFSRRFAKAPRNPFNAHGAPLPTEVLDEIFTGRRSASSASR